MTFSCAAVGHVAGSRGAAHEPPSPPVLASPLVLFPTESYLLNPGGCFSATQRKDDPMNRYKSEWEYGFWPSVLLTVCVLGLVATLGWLAAIAATGEGMGW
jgi:hypothetical protein